MGSGWLSRVGGDLGEGRRGECGGGGSGCRSLLLVVGGCCVAVVSVMVEMLFGRFEVGFILICRRTRSKESFFGGYILWLHLQTWGTGYTMRMSYLYSRG